MSEGAWWEAAPVVGKAAQPAAAAPAAEGDGDAWWKNAPEVGKAPAAAAEPPAEPDPMAGVDLSRPIEELRPVFSQLPEDERKAALDKWADVETARVAKVAGVPRPSPARGTPVGSFLDEASAGIDAAANFVSGGRLGNPYDEALALQRARQRATAAEHPTMNAVAHVAGALGSAPVSPLLRVAQGSGLGASVANMAATGGGYSALYGFGEGEGTADRFEKAGQGATIGATIGAPLGALAHVPAGVRAARDAITRTSPTAELAAAEHGIAIPKAAAGSGTTAKVADLVTDYLPASGAVRDAAKVAETQFADDVARVGADMTGGKNIAANANTGLRSWLGANVTNEGNLVAALGLKAEEATVDGIADQIGRLAKSRNPTDTTRLWNAKQLLDADAWADVSSTTLQRTGGSFKDFGRSYAELSPTARNAMFSNPEHRKALDNLARISDEFGERIAKLSRDDANATSRGLTGAAGLAVDLFMGGGLVTALGVAGKGLSHFLARPAAAKALAKYAAKLRTASQSVPLPQAISELKVANVVLAQELRVAERGLATDDMADAFARDLGDGPLAKPKPMPADDPFPVFDEAPAATEPAKAAAVAKPTKPGKPSAEAAEIRAQLGADFDPADADAIFDMWKFVTDTRKATKSKPQSLADFVIKNGGVKNSGEIRHMIGHAQARPGLINQKGTGLDDMAHRAWEHGFLPKSSRPSIDDFLEALDEDVNRGARQVRVGDDAIMDDMRVADEMAVDLERLGITSKTPERVLREALGMEPVKPKPRPKSPAPSGELHVSGMPAGNRLMQLAMRAPGGSSSPGPSRLASLAGLA